MYHVATRRTTCTPPENSRSTRPAERSNPASLQHSDQGFPNGVPDAAPVGINARPATTYVRLRSLK